MFSKKCIDLAIEVLARSLTRWCRFKWAGSRREWNFEWFYSSNINITYLLAQVSAAAETSRYNSQNWGTLNQDFAPPEGRAQRTRSHLQTRRIYKIIHMQVKHQCIFKLRASCFFMTWWWTKKLTKPSKFWSGVNLCDDVMSENVMMSELCRYVAGRLELTFSVVLYGKAVSSNRTLNIKNSRPILRWDTFFLKKLSSYISHHDNIRNFQHQN